jgi:hypothetical protein
VIFFVLASVFWSLARRGDAASFSGKTACWYFKEPERSQRQKDAANKEKNRPVRGLKEKESVDDGNQPPSGLEGAGGLAWLIPLR